MTPQPGSRRTGAFRTDPALARRVAIKRFLARLVLFSERLLPLFLPLLGIAALFVSFAWLGVYRQLPDLLRLGLVFVLMLKIGQDVRSLLFLLVGAAILVPTILAYTGYAYWVFRGKLDPDEGYH